MNIAPDRKLITKQLMVLFTISIIVIISLVIVHLLVNTFDPEDSSELMPVLWIICAVTLFLMWIISVPVIILWINNLSFSIKEDRVTIHKGIISKIQQNIPYRAVTDFMLHRSPYDRLLGLGSIRVQTAGQSVNATGFEGNLTGLADWSDLHKMLKGRLKMIQTGNLQAGISENDPVDQGYILQEILGELQKIRSKMKD